MGLLLRRLGAVFVVAGITLSSGCSSYDPTAVAQGSIEPMQSPLPTSTALPEDDPVQPSPSTSTTAPKPYKPVVSKATLKYFFKIALGSEYGKSARVVTRWKKPVVTVRPRGSVSSASRKCLNQVVKDFNALTRIVDLKVTKSSKADIQLHFAPVSRFRSLEPSYVPGNDGYFAVWWYGYAIYKGTILIRTTGISSKVRCHLIREELTQAMGLMRDANDYPKSVFYGRYSSAPTKYAAIDKKLIALLYSGALHPGDTKKAVTKAVTVKG